jgi:hypothetical protein
MPFRERGVAGRSPRGIEQPRRLEKLTSVKARVTDSIELREKVTGAVASGEQRISGRTIYLRHDSLVLGVQQNG